MMRFQIVQWDKAQNASNADEYEPYEWDDEFKDYLLDTQTNTIVFADGMEPEDATLSRALGPLVGLMNASAQ